MIIAARQLTKRFTLKRSGVIRGAATLRAVDSVNIQVDRNQTVGVVGESGSGKSTLGRMLVHLLDPTSGHVLFEIPDADLRAYDDAVESVDRETISKIEKGYSTFSKGSGDLTAMRKKMGIVFQDPYSSLDPRLRVVDIIMEPMICTNFLGGGQARDATLTLLDQVGLPRDFAYRYPHELSGGQRQRVALARGIATAPKFLVLDEPTSALDVSVQAQMLDLLKTIRRKFDMSMILITHNIAVVANLCDTVNVMYAGKIMETGPKKDVILSPVHPYTVALISAVPGRKAKVNKVILQGDPPNLIIPPKGCTFHPRCPVAIDTCGWTSDEVAADLEYLAQGKYFDKLGDATKVEIKDERTLTVTGTDATTITRVMNTEKQSSKSLSSIEKVEMVNGAVELKLRAYETPGLYRQTDGRQVSCLLYTSQSS